MFRFSSTASVTLVEVGWLAPCNAKPVRARRFSFETGSEPSRFFRSETPRTIAQPTETWLLDRYAQPRLFFNDFHVRWTNLRGPATGKPLGHIPNACFGNGFGTLARRCETRTHVRRRAIIECLAAMRHSARTRC
jgi:hypothetical protein